MPIDDAVVHAGKGMGPWIVVLTIFTGGLGVILTGLIAGRTKEEMSGPLKWGLICMTFWPLGIGYILALVIACKSASLSENGDYEIELMRL